MEGNAVAIGISNPPVYTGQNTITVNAETMNRIVAAWLHEHHAGGPYEVKSVSLTKCSYGPDKFDITFVDKPVEPGGAI